MFALASSYLAVTGSLTKKNGPNKNSFCRISAINHHFLNYTSSSSNLISDNWSDTKKTICWIRWKNCVFITFATCSTDNKTKNWSGNDFTFYLLLPLHPIIIFAEKWRQNEQTWDDDDVFRNREEQDEEIQILTSLLWDVR